MKQVSDHFFWGGEYRHEQWTLSATTRCQAQLVCVLTGGAAALAAASLAVTLRACIIGISRAHVGSSIASSSPLSVCVVAQGVLGVANAAYCSALECRLV